MYAAASRRHALFPFSGMFSSIKHPYLVSLRMTGLSSVLDGVKTCMAAVTPS